jgi:signal transduction histidine kinase
MAPITTVSYRVDPQPALAEATAVAATGGRASGELLRRLTAALAHNVNNALAGVVGYLELALRSAEPGSPVHAHLTHGLRCALQGAERVRRMVAFAHRPEAALPAMVCLKGAADRAVSRAAVDRPGLGVLLATPAASCPVRANEPLLELVLEQLISNAAEAMPEGGTLTLRAWDEGHRRCLSVGDSGPGLSSEVRRHLFEPYFTTKSFGHLGLGLALCRDVIEAQGGALHITSVEGYGTTVTLSFPPPEEVICVSAVAPSADTSVNGSGI